MRVLITNRTLERRTGTALYARDLALGLLRSGHAPTVFSPRCGEVAEELRAAGVPTVERLHAAAPPDVVHGHHVDETTAALRHFPRVPAVFVCHDRSAWHDTPPRSPRVRRLLAVDLGTRGRLVERENVAPGRVLLIPNGVDLARFRPRDPLPRRPRRVLLFSNYAGPRHLREVRSACRRAGLALDAVGLRLAGCHARPEELLGRYDIVLGKGRCALEAAAVGTAVVVCDSAGLGPMVTADAVEALRLRSFGRDAMGGPVEAAALLREIERYDASDAAEVARRTREAAGLDTLVERLLELYRDVCGEQALEPSDAAAEADATAQYDLWRTRHGPTDDGAHTRLRRLFERLGRAPAGVRRRIARVRSRRNGGAYPVIPFRTAREA